MLLSKCDVCNSLQGGYFITFNRRNTAWVQLVLTVPANRTWQWDSNSFDIHSLLAVKTSVIIGDEAKWVHPHLFLHAIATEV